MAHQCATYRSLATILSFVFMGCGGDPDDARRPPGEDETGEVGSTSSALVGGFALNVSQNVVPSTTFEQETSAVVLDSPPGTTWGVAVAFNSDDPAHKSGNNFCRGYSQSSLSYFTNGTFRGLHFPVPTNRGISYLFGDPWTAVVDSGNTWFLYVYSLGVSDAAWNAVPKQPDGCISPADRQFNLEPDNACITYALIPKDQTAAVDLTPFGTCFGAGGQIDGGSIYRSASTGSLYTAVWNVSNSRIDVFRNGALLPNPISPTLFPGIKMIGHPIFMSTKPTAATNELPMLVAPDSAGRFWVMRFDEQQSSWWASRLTGAGSFANDDVVLQGTSVALRHIGYTADTYNEGSQNVMWFFYSKPKSSSGIKNIQGIKCLFSGPTGSNCNVLSAATNLEPASAYLPSLAIVTTSTGEHRPWLSYWSDNAFPLGNLQMMMSRINVNTGNFTPFSVGTVEKPCPRNTYWGDYDSFSVWGNGSSQPSLLRYLTDSTASACTSNGDPQHVSVVIGNGAL